MRGGWLTGSDDHVRSLDKELDTFRKIFNRRVVYFASLQEISDSVSAPLYELQCDLTVSQVTQPEAADAAMEIETMTQDIHVLERKLAQMEVKGRYLAFLGSQGERDVEALRDDCIICMGSSDDKQLVLLGCGHHFCKVSTVPCVPLVRHTDPRSPASENSGSSATVPTRPVRSVGSRVSRASIHLSQGVCADLGDS